jgi:uncharacterized protein (DUF4415 family)
MKPKAKLVRPTTVADAAINRAIAIDADTRELTSADFARMEPLEEIIRRRGRPKSITHKIPITLRLDPQIVSFFRAGGRGWQTRINDALAGYVSRKPSSLRTARKM